MKPRHYIWAAVLALCALQLPRLPQTLGSESWCLALERARDLHLAFGRDLVWTFGPAAFLYVPNFSTRWCWAQEVAQAGLALSVAWAFVRVLLGMTLLRRVAAGGVFLVGVTWVHLGAPELVLFFGVLFFGILAFSGGIYAALALAAFLAWAAMIKAGFIVVGLGTVVLLTWHKRHPHPFLFFVGLLWLFWVLLGQPILGLPLWVWRSLEVVRGYDGAMTFNTLPVFNTFGIAEAVVVGWVVLRFARGWQKVWFLMLVFVAWKAGYTRADLTHQGCFLFFCPMLAFCVGGLEAPFLALFLSLCAIAWQDGTWMVRQPSEVLNQMATNLRTCFENKHYKQTLLTLNQQQRDGHQLPRISATVSNSIVDVFSWDCGVPVLAGLNYHPRPVPQSFGAYTAKLERLNDAYYERVSPKYVLFNLQPVDNHFAPAEDGLVLLRLVRLYHPVLLENGWMLLRLEDKHAFTKTLVRTGKAAAGQPFSPTAGLGGIVWVETECRSHSRLRRFLRADPLVTVKVKGKEVVAPRECLAAGWLAQPLLFDNTDVMAAPNLMPYEISFSEDCQYRVYQVELNK